MKDIKTAFLSFFGHKGKGKIICIIGIVGILLIFISSFFPLSRDKEETVEGDTSAAYAARLEEQLEEMAADITGARQVRALVTLNSGEEYVYANEEKADSNESDSQDGDAKSQSSKKDSSEKSFVLMNGNSGSQQPLVITKLPPTVKGVVLVCQSAGSQEMQEALEHAVTTALDIPSTRVYVTFTGA